jgi:hypothetical protein
VLTKDMIILMGSLTQGVMNSILLYQSIQTRRGVSIASPWRPRPQMSPQQA